MPRLQFSLAALFVVTMIGIPMGLGLGLPSYRFARSLPWTWTSAWCFFAVAAVVAVGLLVALFRRR